MFKTLTMNILYGTFNGITTTLFACSFAVLIERKTLEMMGHRQSNSGSSSSRGSIEKMFN